MAWCLWMTASVFYAYQNIVRVMPNIMLDDIMRQFHINAAVFGQLSGVYYITYSLAHIPIGLMLDRYGPRNILPTCIVMIVLGLAPIFLADHWGYAVAGRALVGLGSSAAILGTFKIIRMTFEEKSFSRMLGFAVLIGLLGSIYGGGPVSYMCNLWGYQTVVKMVALAGLLLAVLTYLIMPKKIHFDQTTVTSNLREVMTNVRVWLVCLSAGLMVGPLEGFADVWGAAFLKNIYGLDVTTASTMTSMIFVGMCVGAPLLPMLADATCKHLGVVIGAGAMMALCFVALLMGLFTVTSLTMGFFVIGVCCAYQIVAIYKASTYVPEHVAGLTTAVANMIIMSFGYAFHAAIGWVVNHFGGAHTAQALLYGISIIPAALALGIIGFLCLCPTEFEGRASC